MKGEQTAQRLGTKFRAHDWLDIDTMQPVFGVQAKPVTKPRGSKLAWFHVQMNGRPLVYRTAAERDAAVVALNGGGVPLQKGIVQHG